MYGCVSYRLTLSNIEGKLPGARDCGHCFKESIQVDIRIDGNVNDYVLTTCENQFFMSPMTRMRPLSPNTVEMS